MHLNTNVPHRGTAVLLLVLANAVILKQGFILENNFYWLLLLTIPLLLVAMIRR